MNVRAERAKASEKPVKIPGPDHPITITPSTLRVVVTEVDLIVLAAMPTSSEPEPYPTFGDNLKNSK